MRLILLLLTAWISTPGTEDHDVAMATFRLAESDQGVGLDISFDKDDYLNANGLTDRTIELLHFKEYINTATCWTVNGRKLPVEVEKIIPGQHHVSAVCHIRGITFPIREVIVENEFLLDVEEQNNVVILDLNGKSRGFRMHSGRRDITVAY